MYYSVNRIGNVVHFHLFIVHWLDSDGFLFHFYYKVLIFKYAWVVCSCIFIYIYLCANVHHFPYCLKVGFCFRCYVLELHVVINLLYITVPALHSYSPDDGTSWEMLGIIIFLTRESIQPY